MIFDYVFKTETEDQKKNNNVFGISCKIHADQVSWFANIHNTKITVFQNRDSNDNGNGLEKRLQPAPENLPVSYNYFINF